MTIQDLEIRPPLKAFAIIMEQKLKDNDYKGGWASCESSELLRMLKEEVYELEEILNKKEWSRHGRSAGENVSLTDVSGEAIAKECADVANFAMMIADSFTNCK